MRVGISLLLCLGDGYPRASHQPPLPITWPAPCWVPPSKTGQVPPRGLIAPGQIGEHKLGQEVTLFGEREKWPGWGAATSSKRCLEEGA